MAGILQHECIACQMLTSSRTWSMCKVMNPYVGIHQPVTIKHIPCGNVFTVMAFAFLDNKTRCSCVVKNMLHKYAAGVIRKVNGFEVMDFTDIRNECTIKCKKCGNVMHFNRMAHFLVKPYCTVCSPEHYIGSTESFKFQIKSLTGDDYTPVSEYQKTFKPVQIRHNTCGRVFSSSPHKFEYGQRCPYCNKPIKQKEVHS